MPAAGSVRWTAKGLIGDADDLLSGAGDVWTDFATLTISTNPTPILPGGAAPGSQVTAAQAEGGQQAMDVFGPDQDDRLGYAPANSLDPTAASGGGKSTLIGQSFTGGRYVFSGNQDIDATLIGSKWTITNLTYSFPTSGTFYGSNYLDGRANPSYFDPFNAQMQSATKYTLALVAQYSNLTFTQVTEASSTHANLRYAQTGDTNDVGSAQGEFPSDAYYAGDIWLGESGQPYYTTPAKGNWGLATIMHETGHALGLKHGHQNYTSVDLSDDLVVSGPRYGSVALPSNHDGQDWSLMTYTVAPGYQNEFGGEGYNQPQTYMQDDIAALQYLYGANFNTQGGNTVYSWSPTTGEEFINGVGQGAPTSNKISMTVWDGNGSDTYNLSNYSTNLSVDLRPGNFSTFSTAQLVNHRAYTGNTALAVGNVANALLYNGDTRSLIENAVGGSGNDTINGNAVDNVLTGNGGNDSLVGNGGIDTAVFTGNRAQYTLTSSGGSTIVKDNTTGRDGTDTLTGIRLLRFADRTISLAPAVRNDVNGNRTSDVLLQNGGTVVDWIMAGGTYQSGNTITTGAAGYTVRAVGDFSGDTQSDLILQNGSTVVAWFLSGGAYQSGATLTTALPAGYTVVGAGDFNADGYADILLQSGGTVVAWLVKGGQVVSANTLTTGADGYTVVGTGDFNGDGTTDILLQNGGTVIDWLMKNGAYQSGNTIATGADGYAVKGTGDFNGDGTDDVVLQSGDTVVDWILQNGAYQAGNVLTSAAGGYTVRGTGDYNGDGTTDIVLQNGGSVVDWTLSNGLYAAGNVLTTAAGNYNVVPSPATAGGGGAAASMALADAAAPPTAYALVLNT